MKIRNKKIGIQSVKDILKSLESINGFENTIYYVVNRMNKTVVAKELGYSRAGFVLKVKKRSFTNRELMHIFGILYESLLREKEEKDKSDSEKFESPRFLI